MKLYYASIEDRKQGLDINCIEFKSKKHSINLDNLLDFIDELYCGKMKKVVFVAMAGSDSSDYFITDNYSKVINHFLDSEVNLTFFLFEEPTYEEAFEYCKDHCEIHELGLNN